MGKDCACLSVVLVLECIAVRDWCTDTAYGQGLRLSLVVLVLCALVYGYGLWAKACFSVVLALSALCAHWCTDTAHGQGLRFLSVVLVLSASGAHHVHGELMWRLFFSGPCTLVHCQGFPPLFPLVAPLSVVVSVG